AKCVVDKIREIIFAQASCLFRYKRQHGFWESNLISFDHWQATGRKSSLLDIEMRAREMYERGGIYLNDENRVDMAHRAKMPINLIRKVLDNWLGEGYLLERENGVFNVGPKYPEAELMFKTAGKLELAAPFRVNRREKETKQIH